MDTNNTNPKPIPALEIEEVGSTENPCAPKVSKGQVEILVTLLALVVTEGVKLGAELLIKKLTRR